MHRALLVLLLSLATLLSTAQAQGLVVGSKRFTESYVLGELTRLALEDAGLKATHRAGLGNTAILDQALRSGSIDVYPEYTGTIVRELLKREPAAPPKLAELNAWLAPLGLKAAVPLGFNNTYALALPEQQAARLGLRTLSDLARLPAAKTLRLGLSHEFLVRADGWPALKTAYALPQASGRGLDHGLAYAALSQGQVDVMDVYSTDAQIERLGLRVLQDDRAFFPRYDAVLLMRASLDESPLRERLEGRINEALMTRLNAQVEIDRQPYAEVAARQFAQWRSRTPVPAQATSAESFWTRLLAPDLPRLLSEHLVLVAAALALALLFGLPLGVLAHGAPRLGGLLNAMVSALQTVPSLALLALLIALLGRIGWWPALLALFVYALLPVLHSTQAGLAAVPKGLREAAIALGMTHRQCLQHVELPLAMPLMLAGLKTAAVLAIGTATVAAFVGAGGLGERIVAGLAVNDTALMLAGALPAALLALLAQWLLGAWERRWQRRVAGRG
jgi:osmoprotectant transport system permease protein